MPGSETFSSFVTADIRTPFFSADVLKKCSLVGMYLRAEEGRGGKDGCHALDLGDMWRYGCQKGPMWKSDDEDWSEDESVSSGVSREDSVCNVALHVIGLYGVGGKISLSSSWRIGSLRGRR